MFLQSDIDKYNEQVKQWTDETRSIVIAAIDNAGVQHRKNSPDAIALQRSVKSSNKKQFDFTNRVSFSFNRSMVWLQKGVSRGHGKDNPRKKKDVFNDPVTNRLDLLADIAAENQGTMVVNALLIK
jgi:hypothetical protein